MRLRTNYGPKNPQNLLNIIKRVGFHKKGVENTVEPELMKFKRVYCIVL